MEPQHGESWIATDAINRPGHPLINNLNELLLAHRFDEHVRPALHCDDSLPSIP